MFFFWNHHIYNIPIFGFATSTFRPTRTTRIRMFRAHTYAGESQGGSQGVGWFVRFLFLAMYKMYQFWVVYLFIDYISETCVYFYFKFVYVCIKHE